MAQSLPDSSEMRSRYSADRFTPYVRDMLAKLSESDAEFIRSLPIAAVNAEKNQSSLSIAQTVERCLLAI